MSLVVSNNWGSYSVDLGNIQELVRYDRALENALYSGFAKAYPHNLELSLYAEITTLQGLPASNDFDLFNKIEDEFAKNGYDFYHVAAISGAGNRRFIFWLSQEASENVKEIVKALLGNHINLVRHTYNLTLNDSYSFYENNIEPCMRKFVEMITRKICDEMKNEGEAFNMPRIVDFYCTIHNPKQITAATKMLVDKKGFTEVSVSMQNKNGYRIHITKTLIPTAKNITEQTNHIIDVLMLFGGYFNYWYSPVYSF